MSYAASMLFLDTLGVSAVHGLNVVVKQAFFGFWFSLLDADYQPTPSYWIAYAYKQLVGVRVLRTAIQLDSIPSAPDEPSKLRAYSHCTSRRSGYAQGSVVTYVMNLYDGTTYVNFTHMTPNTTVDEYLFTPHKQQMDSLLIEFNGKVIKLVNDTTLPRLMPKHLGTTRGATMPPKSMAFYAGRPGAAGAYEVVRWNEIHIGL